MKSKHTLVSVVCSILNHENQSSLIVFRILRKMSVIWFSVDISKRMHRHPEIFILMILDLCLPVCRYQ